MEESFKNFNKVEFRLFQEESFDLDSDGLELPISEHVDEIRQRIFQVIGFLCCSVCVIFFNITHIVELLEAPIQQIRFIQLAPGEYFLATVKIAFYGGLIVSLPIVISQLIFYLLPGLTTSEKGVVIPILITSVILLGVGILFAYYILIPAALNFFIDYSTTVIEPIWSFDQYFDFILFLFYSTGLSFQVPIIQILIGLTGIVNGRQMLGLWRYIILAATIISAVLTPSTDPITQLCLASAIVFLYLTGATILIVYNK